MCLYQLIYAISYVISLYRWILIIYIFMSWVPNIQQSSIGQLFARLCEPYLQPFRRLIPPIGMIDISPYAAFIVLWLAQIGIRDIPILIQNLSG